MTEFIEEWMRHAVALASTPADFYCGARKILLSRVLAFYADPRDNTVQLADAGYSKMKYNLLRKHYWHNESIAAAKLLWDKRRRQAKYGSVGFHCYNHFVKGGGTVEEMIAGEGFRSKRSSVFGPCIQAVTVTLIDKRRAAITVNYRTTELFKKFPADLVLLGDMLREFDFDNLEIVTTTFMFAGITCHPMYFVTIIPHLDKPIDTLRAIRKQDLYFHDWIVKWSSRYLVPEHHRGIDKFQQAKRVMKDANERIPNRIKDKLLPYMREHHPGYRNEYAGDDVDDEEESDGSD